MRKTTALITALLILLALFRLPGAAGVGDDGPVATYSSPALCAETGKTLDLASCSVQFEQGAAVVAGSDIVWKDGENVIKSYTPASDGVHTLTATSNGLTKRVYVVSAAAGAEYVIYENDFTTDPRATLRTVQQTSGALIQHDAAAGTLVLDGTPPTDGYIRVLFPEFLDDFGDLVIECSLKLTSYKSAASRWGSVMFRVQNGDYPYMQAALRYNSTSSNGCELAERTSSNAWNVIGKGPGSASNTEFNTLRIDAAGREALYVLNGKEVVSLSNVPYSDGGVGLQVRGTRMEVDSIKITVNPRSTSKTNELPGGYARVEEEKTNIALAPFIVSPYGESTEAGSFPVTLFLPDVYLSTFDRTAFLKNVDEALGKTEGKTIPCFRVSSQDAAVALAERLKELDMRDAYLLSGSADAVAAARKIWTYINGVIDYSTYAGDDPEAMRAEATEAGARTVILPERFVSKTDVAALQDRYLSCWAVAENQTGAVRAINSGVYGLFCPTPELASTLPTLMNELYDQNTLVRYSNIIGHRGVPSLAQENSVAGSRQAFDLGACMVENDIHLSSDGVLVVMHDATIDRTTNGTGSVASMTYRQIAQFNIVSNTSAGPQPIPTLEDYFKEFCHGEKLVIELKNNNASLARPLASLIEKYGMEKNVVVISFYEAAISALREIMPEVPAAWLNSSIALDETDVYPSFVSIMDVIQPLGTVFSPSYAKGSLGCNTVRALMLRGVSTWIWTVNDGTAFNKYFLMGIRGITTNYSQWAGSYLKSVEASCDDNGRWTVTVETYAGEKKDVTAEAKLKIVETEGNATATFDAAEGKIVCRGTASVFFSVTGLTSTKDKYSLVTDLITVTGDAGEAATTEAETGQGEVQSAEVTTGETAAKKGCGAVASGAAVLAVTLCSAAALRRRREQ